MARVLLIHDVARPGPDKDLWSHLETAGHQVFPTPNGGPASSNTNDFDIAVVDVGLREGKGQKLPNRYACRISESASCCWPTPRTPCNPVSTA